MAWFRALLFVALWMPLHTVADTRAALGDALLTLDGPWKFHTGDDPHWSEPGFDDAGWETVDLRAPLDATDGDVGITSYTAGWGAKGHPGYHGFAWYRLRLTATPPDGESLALLGPWAVDSAY